MGYWIVTVTKARPDSTNLGNVKVKVYFKAKQSDQEDLSLKVDDATDSADFDPTITRNPTVNVLGKDYPVYPDTVVVRGNWRATCPRPWAWASTRATVCSSARCGPCKDFKGARREHLHRRSPLACTRTSISSSSRSRK